MSLTRKLLLLSLLLAVIPLATVGYLAYASGQQALQEAPSAARFDQHPQDSEFERWVEGEERQIRLLAAPAGQGVCRRVELTRSRLSRIPDSSYKHSRCSSEPALLEEGFRSLSVLRAA